MREILLLLAFLSPAAAVAEPSLAPGPPKLTFGGQLRLRGEATGLQAYAPVGLRRGQDLFLIRTRLSLLAEMGSGVAAFLQLQDSRTSGTEASVVANSANVDLHQGYLDVGELFGAPLDLRAGRMELSYGDQRLVSPLEWSNVMRAWDGLRLRHRWDKSTADAFVTKIKEVADLRRDQLFWGLYGSCRALPGREADLYLLGRDFGDGSLTNEHGTKGNLSDRTVGLRYKGTRGGFEHTSETAWQFGRRAGMVVRAWGAAVTAGYAFSAAYKPKLGAEYDYASGDGDPSDNKFTTFDPLFPYGHALQGYQDIFSWRNGHAVKLSGSLEPVGGWRLALDLHHFLLAHSRDAWYDAATAAIARDATGASGREVGHEVDLHLKGKFRGLLDVWLGYSRFFAGSFVRGASGGRDRDWAFLQTALNF